MDNNASLLSGFIIIIACFGAAITIWVLITIGYSLIYGCCNGKTDVQSPDTATSTNGHTASDTPMDLFEMLDFDSNPHIEAPALASCYTDPHQNEYIWSDAQRLKD